MDNWQRTFKDKLKSCPLVVYMTSSPDYLRLQLATPLDDNDDAILLYVIEEEKGAYSISDQCWISILIPYEKHGLTDEKIQEEALKMGFELSGMNIYRMVDEDTILQAISDFDLLIKKLQNLTIS